MATVPLNQEIVFTYQCFTIKQNLVDTKRLIGEYSIVIHFYVIKIKFSNLQNEIYII